MQIMPLTEHVGAEVRGVDLARPLPEADIQRLRAALAGHGVLVFRGQDLSEEQHIAFSRRFGPLEIHIAKQYLLPEHPEIVVLSNRRRPDGTAEGIEDAGRYWHSDLSYLQMPSLGSLLYARVVPPPEQGGDTLFASMYAAWQALPRDLQDRLRGATAIHNYDQRWKRDADEGRARPALSAAERAATPDAIHPVVRLHPESRRPALYVNEGFTVRIRELPAEESAAVLAEIYRLAARPEAIYRHRWQAGDLIFWDNRSLVHAATWYDPAATRHMHRTTIACDAPPIAA